MKAFVKMMGDWGFQTVMNQQKWAYSAAHELNYNNARAIITEMCFNQHG